MNESKRKRNIEKRVVFVVGHRNWGKTSTIRALKRICQTGEQEQYVMIGSATFWVRSQSNDDDPIKYEKALLERTTRSANSHIIAAFCPRFNGCPSDRMRSSHHVDGFIRRLKQNGCRLFFWAIRHKQNSSASRDILRECEISEMGKHGQVKVFETKDKQRILAEHLHRYISVHVV